MLRLLLAAQPVVLNAAALLAIGLLLLLVVAQGAEQACEQ